MYYYMSLCNITFLTSLILLDRIASNVVWVFLGWTPIKFVKIRVPPRFLMIIGNFVYFCRFLKYLFSLKPLTTNHLYIMAKILFKIKKLFVTNHWIGMRWPQSHLVLSFKNKLIFYWKWMFLNVCELHLFWADYFFHLRTFLFNFLFGWWQSGQISKYFKCKSYYMTVICNNADSSTCHFYFLQIFVSPFCIT